MFKKVTQLRQTIAFLVPLSVSCSRTAGQSNKRGEEGGTLVVLECFLVWPHFWSWIGHNIDFWHNFRVFCIKYLSLDKIPILYVHLWDISENIKKNVKSVNKSFELLVTHSSLWQTLNYTFVCCVSKYSAYLGTQTDLTFQFQEIPQFGKMPTLNGLWLACF